MLHIRNVTLKFFKNEKCFHCGYLERGVGISESRFGGTLEGAKLSMANVYVCWKIPEGGESGGAVLFPHFY